MEPTPGAPYRPAHAAKDWQTGWHVYAAEWREDRLDSVVDGNLYVQTHAASGSGCSVHHAACTPMPLLNTLNGAALRRTHTHARTHAYTHDSARARAAKPHARLSRAFCWPAALSGV